MRSKKAIKQTIHKYSIVDRATGRRENIKDVVLTYYHNNIVELLTISNDFLVYESDKILIEKY